LACANRQAEIKGADAHFERGSALVDKGDRDAAIAEYRDVIRLGHALEAKGDRKGALEERGIAAKLEQKKIANHTAREHHTGLMKRSGE
jgi:hypothetical protein